MSANSDLLIRLGGEGPDVVLLHGYGADRQSWLATAPALFDHATVWALDLPGHGQCVAPAQSDGSIQTLTDHVAHSIKQAELMQYHLIGHSLGGRLALELSHRAPESVLSLVLLAPAGVSTTINQGFLADFANASNLESVTTVLTMLTHDPRLISPALGAGVLQYLETPGTRKALHAIAKALLDTQKEVTQLQETLQRDDSTPRLCIWGADDRINPPDSKTTTVFGEQLHVLKNCGHLPHIEKRVLVNRLITAFHESIMNRS